MTPTKAAATQAKGIEMIDINKLRRLVQAATPGPWVSHGRYIGTPRHMSYIGEVRDQCGNWSDTEKSRSDAAYIAAANPAVINELLDRLEAAESARRDDYQNWMTALDRNAELLAKLEAAEKERDALRAELETERMRLTACGVVALRRMK